MKKNFVFLGDVPCSRNIYDKVRNATWMLHEANVLGRRRANNKSS